MSYHKVPHLYLGRLTGFENCKLYVFFPELFSSTRLGNFLLDSEYSRFIDIVLQATHQNQHINDSILQHLPSSFLDAKARSMARANETGVKKTASEPRIQLFHFHIHSDALYSLWNDIMQALQQPGYQDLQNPILLLDAKNLKTMFRNSKPSMVVMDFLQTWNFAFNPKHLNPSSLWIDFAKEITIP